MDLAVAPRPSRRSLMKAFASNTHGFLLEQLSFLIVRWRKVPCFGLC